VNCVDPAGVVPAARAAGAAGLPVVVYPNSGERWDATARRWTGEPALRADGVGAWLDAGAGMVGGCCRVRPEHIRAMAAVVRGG
jgi:homocysteine S-methyltransferase